MILVHQADNKVPHKPCGVDRKACGRATLCSAALLALVQPALLTPFLLFVAPFCPSWTPGQVSLHPSGVEESYRPLWNSLPTLLAFVRASFGAGRTSFETSWSSWNPLGLFGLATKPSSSGSSVEPGGAMAGIRLSAFDSDFSKDGFFSLTKSAGRADPVCFFVLLKIGVLL